MTQSKWTCTTSSSAKPRKRSTHCWRRRSRNRLNWPFSNRRERMRMRRKQPWKTGNSSQVRTLMARSNLSSMRSRRPLRRASWTIPSSPIQTRFSYNLMSCGCTCCNSWNFWRKTYRRKCKCQWAKALQIRRALRTSRKILASPSKITLNNHKSWWNLWRHQRTSRSPTISSADISTISLYSTAVETGDCLSYKICCKQLPRIYWKRSRLISTSRPLRIRDKSRSTIT